MPPGRGEHACTEQGHPLATDRRVCDEDAPPHSHYSPSPFPASEAASETKQMRKDVLEPQPLGSLPEGPLVEILSRVPYRSLCRFKCVSKPWLALCSDPAIRKRSPQTLSGFFYQDGGRFKFHNLSGRGAPPVDPSLPFLIGSYECFTVEQCCRSLLLLRCWEPGAEEDDFDYVVCNPATEEWTELPPVIVPDNQEGGHVLYSGTTDVFLCFDPAVPTRFVVLAPMSNCFCEFSELAIYSSETGGWTSVQSEWGYKTILVGCSEFVLLNGIIHLSTHYSSIVTVDMEWKVWREIEMPDDMPSSYDGTSIGQSQGCLYAWQIDNHHDCKLYVWVLEDYESGKWTLKHTINVLELFGRPSRKDDESYTMFAIHPDCNVIFLTDEEEMTVSYDMDNQKVHVMSTSQDFLDGLPYVPCFAEWSTDE